jgi:hypothetical protein
VVCANAQEIQRNKHPSLAVDPKGRAVRRAPPNNGVTGLAEPARSS